jgi:hypothetical protein
MPVPQNEGKFDSSHCQSQIHRPLSEWRSGQAGAADQRLIAHIGDARSHAGMARSHSNSDQRTA